MDLRGAGEGTIPRVPTRKGFEVMMWYLMRSERGRRFLLSLPKIINILMVLSTARGDVSGGRG